MERSRADTTSAAQLDRHSDRCSNDEYRKRQRRSSRNTTREDRRSRSTHETELSHGAPERKTEMQQISETIRDVAANINRMLLNWEGELTRVPQGETRLRHYEKLTESWLLKFHCENLMKIINTSEGMNQAQQKERQTVAAVAASHLDTNREGEQDHATRAKKNTAHKMESSFALIMAARIPSALNPEKIVYEAIAGTPIHIARIRRRAGDIEAKFWIREHAELTLQILKEKSINAAKLVDYFNIFIRIEADCSIKTRKFGNRQLARMSYVREGKINHAEAEISIRERNSLWFKEKGDIISVELTKVSAGPASKYILEVYMTAEAHNRYLDHSIEGKSLMDIGNGTLETWSTIRDETCYRCLQTGHWWKDCKAATANCRFCLESHLSKTCERRNRSPEHICRTCTETNEHARNDEEKVDTRHAASSTKCPAVRARRAALTQHAMERNRASK